nr:LysM peptidoglycan-binding domain-containing protein [uncultured Actinotalea sp.]
MSTAHRFDTAARPSAPALRLTRRGRVTVGLLSGAIALGGVLTAQTAVAGGPDGALDVSAHVVRQGDTVWQIAADVVGPGEDVRDVVARIEQLNGLDGGALQIGQRLVVPEG